MITTDSIQEQKKAKHAAYMRKYNRTKKGREYNRSHMKKWRKRNPKVRHGKRPTQVSKGWWNAIVYFLLERDGENCCFCNQLMTLIDIQIDHKIPVMLGGEDRMYNLRLAHKTCNIKHGLLVRKELYGY